MKHYKSTLIILLVMIFPVGAAFPPAGFLLIGITIAYAIAAPIYAKEKKSEEPKPE